MAAFGDDIGVEKPAELPTDEALELRRSLGVDGHACVV